MRTLKKLRISKHMPGVNFYRKDKFAFVFRKVGLTGYRVKTDPAFSATRKKAAGFAHASQIAGRLCKTLRPFLTPSPAKSLYKRLLTGMVMEMNYQGGTPGKMNMAILQNFQCNPRSFAQTLIHLFCGCTCNSGKKTMEVFVPSLVPVRDIDFPLGATHVRLLLVLALYAKDTAAHEVIIHNPPVFYRLNRTTTKPITLSIKTTRFNPCCALALIGLQFYYAEGDELMSYDNQKWDTMDIIECYT